jgi:hypothetical protein
VIEPCLCFSPLSFPGCFAVALQIIGSVLWVKYYADGRPIRESTGTKDKKQAVRFLKGREGRIVLGQPVMPRAGRVRYEEIAMKGERGWALSPRWAGSEWAR